MLSLAFPLAFIGSGSVPRTNAPAVAIAQKASIQAKIEGGAKVGDNTLSITLSDSSGKPISGAKVQLTVAMSEMDMGVAHAIAMQMGPGIYSGGVKFSMAGAWRVVVAASVAGQKPVTQSFEFKVQGPSMPSMQMSGMDMGGMMGKLGDWGMQREGSGTSWLTDSSPMFMKQLPPNGRYDLSVMGSFSLNYSTTNGPRGDHRFFSNSMPMLMATRETGGGTIGLNLMVSLDPVFNGEYGYPDLFQTGETAYGKPLVDYQHPHNLISELTASYSHPIGGGFGAFFYGGPVGEPALGGPMFMHRPSGMEIPEAPITHHWFDSTHISYGVITLGVNNPRWQLEGSVFNGHEPGENRYSPDPIGLNSASTRLTFNPSKELSLSASHGYLNSPESTSPGVDQQRTTASAIWSKNLRGSDNLSLTALYGHILQTGENSDAYVLEGTYYTGPSSYFVRWENVAKDDLANVPAGDYRINKLVFGLVRNFAELKGFDVGVGGYAGVYGYPSSLDPYYGHGPVTLGVFLRVRPGRM